VNKWGIYARGISSDKISEKRLTTDETNDINNSNNNVSVFKIKPDGCVVLEDSDKGDNLYTTNKSNLFSIVKFEVLNINF
jgi:hypothetical protein